MTNQISQMLAQPDMHTLWIISMACLQKEQLT